MRKSILLLILYSVLFAQSHGVVLATYFDGEYMDSLQPGSKLQLPDSILQKIAHFEIISYEQAFPYSSSSSLKSVIAFKCKDSNVVAFADYLETNASIDDFLQDFESVERKQVIRILELSKNLVESTQLLLYEDTIG